MSFSETYRDNNYQEQIVPSAHLSSVYQGISALVAHQHREQQANFAREQRQILPQVDLPIFSCLQHRVAHAALKKLGAELRLSHQGDYPVACMCIVRKVMGLPCGHELARWSERGVPVPLSAIHQHWRFDAEVAEESENDVPALLDPLPPRRTR